MYLRAFILQFFILIGIGSLLPAQTIIDSSNQKPQADSLLSTSKINGTAQIDLVDYLVKFFKVKNPTQKRDNQKVRFTLFPTTTSSGKTSFTSFNASFLMGGNAKNTNVSTYYFYPYLGFGGQYGFDVQSYVWLPQNTWNFVGEYFIHNYPQNTWGLGGDSPNENETLVDYDQIRVHQKSMKELWTHFSLGLGYALDYHYNVALDQSESDSLVSILPLVQEKTVSSGLLIPLLYDSRHNSANPKQGFMAALTFRFNSPYLGSDEKWQYLFLDTRKYFPVFRNRKDNILAFRGYYWTVLSGTAPYLDLPSVRWEPSPGQASRGIQQNRYKSNALMYFDSEYRFGISDNGFIGGVVFGSVTSASEYETQQFKYWHPAGGAGIRMKFNKYSDTNISLDFAASKGFFSVYLFIGEAF
jgi:hypothetical protein